VRSIEEAELTSANGGSASSQDGKGVMSRLLPILRWLPCYQRAWLLPDVLAGLAVWAVMVPEGMAYAGIVGVPAIMGLYTIVPPLIVYALLGTSRLLVVGPDTATGLISALTVGAIAAQGTALNGVLAHTAGDHRDLPPHCVNHPDTSNLCGVGAIGTDCVWAHDNLYRQIVATPGRTAAGR